MLATDFNEAEITGWSCGKHARNKYHFYHQGHGICPKATGTTWVVIKDWAKYDGKPNCCATCLALLALAAPAPELAPAAEQAPAPFNHAQDAQHFADVRVQQDREAGVAEGWASTKPGETKYHYYRKGGVSLCSYQRRKGKLYYTDTKRSKWEYCEACTNHLERTPAPEPVTPARPRPTVATGPQPVQLALF
jgi:hypothetical protein